MKQIMYIARAELRNTRRLTRYWIFLGFACIATLIQYLQFSYIHGVFSSYSGALGAYSPRFLMIPIGLYYSVIFLVGTIFIAFDLRHRDKRERIVEVLDSRPYANLELVAGRFLGICLSVWTPIVLLPFIFELTGLILSGQVLSVREVMANTAIRLPWSERVTGIRRLFLLRTSARRENTTLNYISHVGKV